MNEDTTKTGTLSETAPGTGTQSPKDSSSLPFSKETDEAPHEISPEEFQSLKDKAAKADEHWNRLQRVAADLENYKKRAARERQEAIKFANEALLERLIPVLDNFEMALQSANEAKGNTDALKAGVSMIHSQLKSAMNEAGLDEIDANDKPFDPNLHEAVSQQESNKVPEGHVLQQLRKGYKLRDRLLRPASVVVSRKAVT